MKVLIVSKTRQGAGACVGGITSEGKSVRLIAPPGADERWGLAYEIGAAWLIEGDPPDRLVPPHIENIVVRSRQLLGPSRALIRTIDRHMPPHVGSPDGLYEGKLQTLPSSSLYIAKETGVPSFSTTFWRPDAPLTRSTDGKRIHYRYHGPNGDSQLVFVGFQEPIQEIPAGTLARVSLAHWWTPRDHPEDTPRCFVQLSGWYDLPFDEPNPTIASVAKLPAPPVATKPTMMDAACMMSRVFGYEEFRPLQKEIIGAVLCGKDALGVMPTGSGKSLCFQLPALLLHGLTVVVSPLISLMQDHIDQLRLHGVKAVALNSSLSHAEYIESTQRVRDGSARILYLAPETLIRPEINLLLNECNVSLFTVDEAHCISEWGHDFRPEYRQIRQVRDCHPRAACIAITATATERVRQDIRDMLAIDKSCTFVAPFDRPNLYLRAVRRDNGLAQLLEFLHGREHQSGIVYCLTREQVDTLADGLNSHGIPAVPYHAGLDDPVRRTNQRRFQSDDVPVIVATIAFGMGINKSNVRFVVHYAMPQSIETYYQQIGRAGRDGLQSDCLLLFSRSDIHTARYFIEQSPQEEQIGMTARLQAMARYSQTNRCRRHPLLTYFGDAAPAEPCAMCDNCKIPVSDAQKTDVSDDARLLLSAVDQTRQRWGSVHVVSVLRGSRSIRTMRSGHNELPIYGQGKHRKEQWWRTLIDRLVESNLLKADEEYGTLKITPDGRRAMAGAPVCVAMAETAVSLPDSLPGATIEYDPLLFEELRDLRRTLADQAQVPAFFVFSDQVLVDLARSFPQTEEAFRQIRGIGEHKTAHYAKPFTELIQQYVKEHGMQTERTIFLKGRQAEIGNEFASGFSVGQLQARWNVNRETIVRNLGKFVLSGGNLEVDRLLSECPLAPECQSRVFKAFDELGTNRLAPVYESLNGEVPYVELHLIRIILIIRARQT